MSTATPIQRLSRALKAVTDGGDAKKLVDLARGAGVDGIMARRAAKGIEINVGAYLKLCMAVDHDPFSVGPISLDRPCGDLQWNYVGAALKGQRFLRGQSIAEAKKTIGNISDATISRVENGNECSIEHFLSICAYLGRHPYSMLAPVPHVKHDVKDIDPAKETVTA